MNFPVALSRNPATFSPVHMLHRMTGVSFSLSYFAFELLWNDEYQINCYTGSYDLLKNDELVIPKTFNGKKITHLGGTDGFMKASGANKQFTLVLNENITHLNSEVFSGTLVEKVTGNTSGLVELGGSSVFAKVNSKGGYKLDIQLDNPGRILCGYKCFENVDVTVFYPNGFPEPKDQALKGEAREWIRKRIIMKRNPNMQKNNGQNTVNKQNRLDER